MARHQARRLTEAGRLHLTQRRIGELSSIYPEALKTENVRESFGASTFFFWGREVTPQILALERETQSELDLAGCTKRVDAGTDRYAVTLERITRGTP